MSAYADACASLSLERRRWLVTGAAGFIGSNLVETLLTLGQDVTGLDNFATGYRRNLDEVSAAVGEASWKRFHLIDGDITDPMTCSKACDGIDYVLHQAALGSVPRSIEDPRRTHAANVDGFLNMLIAARDAKARRFVYASSSAVYGDDPALPKSEDVIGAPLSPYALSKLIDEQYAEVFGRCYGFHSIGLRYFNVFGQRQDPQGDYAAVIPRWIALMLAGESVSINGDGETSRDFCYVGDVVQVNILAALANEAAAAKAIYNVAVGEQTTLLQLYDALRKALAPHVAATAIPPPLYRDFRPGDVRHSVADIRKTVQALGYAPAHDFGQGLSKAIDWYVAQRNRVA